MSPVRPTVTIVVPTCDRPDAVQECVDALVRSCAEGSALVTAIVVVDNGQRTDPLRLEVANDAGVRVCVVREAVPGVSRARNHGLALATSDIVAFVDDDVIVDPGWLGSLVRPLDDVEVAAVVGPIRLDLRAPRPRWLTPHLESLYSAFDLGGRDRRLAAHEYGLTANLAVRRDIAARIGGFDTRLGPGTRVAFGEDTEFLDRLRDSGDFVAYAAGATVAHRVDAVRLRLGYLVGRAFLIGRSIAEMRRIRNARSSRRDPIRALGALAGVVVRGFPLLVRGARDATRRPGLVVEQLAARSAHLGTAFGYLSGGVTTE